jgi:hypothetical protein
VEIKEAYGQEHDGGAAKDGRILEVIPSVTKAYI